MKPIHLILILSICFSTSLEAQTFTMGKKCRAALADAETLLTSKDLKNALISYEAFSEKCRTKDAKEAAAIGLAEVYNGLKEYDKAIMEADKALKVTKNRSLGGHFQKALALNGKGDSEGYKSSLNEVITLTEKNENIEQRASNYALMADLYNRQAETDSAIAYLDKAKSLDPENISFLLQEGDMYLANKDYNSAFKAYEAAALTAPDSEEVYITKANARLIQMNDKYGTTNAQELRDKMTNQEKSELCRDLNKALELGWKDMNKDMFAALVCNQ